jgi:cytoskeleton protein RodZ
MNEKHGTLETTGLSDSGIETAADLRSVREARGLSLRDVFVATRVSMINLQAVESEDFERLPPPVYARNFIRKYARVIGIDATPLLARYERHLEQKKPPRAAEEEGEEVRQPWPANGRRWRFLVPGLAAVILAGIAVYAVFLYDQAPPASVAAPAASAPAEEQKSAPPGEQRPAETESATPPETTTPAPRPAVATTQPPPAPPLTPPATGKPPPAAPEGNRHLVIAARELTWIRITQDHTPPYEILLKPGERIERTADEFFLLDIGNAGGLHLTFQGKELGTLGKSGQTLQLRLPGKTAEETSTP